MGAGVGAADQQVAVERHPVPYRRGFLARKRRHRERRRPPPGRGVETDAGRSVSDVNAVGGRDVVGAAGVGAGLVESVVVGLADAGQAGLPEQPAGVNVHGAEDIDALDEQPAADHLRLGAVAVARQDAVVRWSAEPEQAERSPHDPVARDARVGGVGVFVGPVGGARQRPFPRQQHPIAGHADPHVGQPRAGRQVRQRGLVVESHRQASRAAVRPQRGERLGQKRFPDHRSNAGEVFRNHQLGQVRRQLRELRRRLDHGHALAVQPGVAHGVPKRLRPVGVRLDDDYVEPTLAQQFFDQSAGADAPGDAVAVAGAGRVEEVARPVGPAVVRRRVGRRRQRVRQDLAARGAEAVEAPLARGHEQSAVGGQQVDRPALDGRLPGNSRRAGRQRAVHRKDPAHCPDVDARAGRRQRFNARQGDDGTHGEPGRVGAGRWAEPRQIIGPQLRRRGGQEPGAGEDGVIADGAEVAFRSRGRRRPRR